MIPPMERSAWSRYEDIAYPKLKHTNKFQDAVVLDAGRTIFWVCSTLHDHELLGEFVTREVPKCDRATTLNCGWR